MLADAKIYTSDTDVEFEIEPFAIEHYACEFEQDYLQLCFSFTTSHDFSSEEITKRLHSLQRLCLSRIECHLKIPPLYDTPCQIQDVSVAYSRERKISTGFLCSANVQLRVNLST